MQPMYTGSKQIVPCWEEKKQKNNKKALAYNRKKKKKKSMEQDSDPIGALENSNDDLT